MPSEIREPDDAELIERLRLGDEASFVTLVERYQGAMVRLAASFVHDRETAQEVAQDAWLGVLRGLANFEGRSSLRSWIFAIVANKAKTRAIREKRSTPFSALASAEASGGEPAVDPARFFGSDAEWPGHWCNAPQSWGENPETLMLRGETMERLWSAIDELPPAQRAVVMLRDVPTICNVLEISETNMRVLLHRARSRIRGALERHMANAADGSGGSP